MTSIWVVIVGGGRPSRIRFASESYSSCMGWLQREARKLRNGELDYKENDNYEIVKRESDYSLPYFHGRYRIRQMPLNESIRSDYWYV